MKCKCNKCGEFEARIIFDMVLSNNEFPFNKSIKSFVVCPVCKCNVDVVDYEYNKEIGANVWE